MYNMYVNLKKAESLAEMQCLGIQFTYLLQ